MSKNKTESKYVNLDGYYIVKMRHHYGVDMHDYYTLVVDTPKYLELKRRNNLCIGHSIDTPLDDIYKEESLIDFISRTEKEAREEERQRIKEKLLEIREDWRNDGQIQVLSTADYLIENKTMDLNKIDEEFDKIHKDGDCCGCYEGDIGDYYPKKHNELKNFLHSKLTEAFEKGKEEILNRKRLKELLDDCFNKGKRTVINMFTELRNDENTPQTLDQIIDRIKLHSRLQTLEEVEKKILSKYTKDRILLEEILMNEILRTIKEMKK